MERKRDGSNLDARVMDKNGGEKERERKTTTNVSVKCKKKKVGKVESEPAWFTFLPPSLMHPIPFPISTFLISNGSFEMAAGPRGRS